MIICPAIKCQQWAHIPGHSLIRLIWKLFTITRDDWTLVTPHPSQLRHSIPGQDNPARGFITAPWTLHSVCCQNEYIITIRPPKTCFKALLYFKGDILKVSRKSESQSFCECYLHRNILWASVLCGYICVCEMFNFIITLTEKCKLCYSMEVNSSTAELHICIFWY